jgi:hypothetical protein
MKTDAGAPGRITPQAGDAPPAFVTIGCHDLGTLFGEQDRRRLSDAGCGTCYDGNFAF